MNWDQIDIVFLDMDGTLLDLYFDNYFWHHHLPKRYTEIHNVSHEEALQRIIPAIEARQGTLEWYCLDFWEDEFKVDLVALKHEISHLIQYRPHIKNFLSTLKKQGKQLILATNAHRKSLNVKLTHTDLADYMDKMYSSHDLGHAKEERAFWEKLSAKEPFDKRRSLFIDDNLQVLRAAKAFGLENLLAIRKPDSQGQEKDTEEFNVFEDCMLIEKA